MSQIVTSSPFSRVRMDRESKRAAQSRMELSRSPSKGCALGNSVPLRDCALCLHNHLLDYLQIVHCLMNSRRNEPDSLSYLAVGILLRRATKILLEAF